MRYFKIPLLFAMLVIFVSCKEKDSIPKGSVEFSFVSKAESGDLKSTANTNDFSAVLVTFVDDKGSIVLEKKQIELHKFNTEYITAPIALAPGIYTISEYFILDANEDVAYASPFGNSELAYLVEAPLPIDFIVTEEAVTKVSPEVLKTEHQTPGDFGYTSFGVSTVETIDFLLAAFIYNEMEENFELTSATITVNSGDDTLYSGDILAQTNKIRVSANYSEYQVSLTKEGYFDFNSVFAIDSLKKHFSSPLTVILHEEGLPSRGLIAYYPFDNNVDDYSESQNHCIDNTEGVYVEGVYDKALYFNGTTDFLQLSNTLDVSNGLTVSFWVKSENLMENERAGTVLAKYNMYSDYTCFNITTRRVSDNASGLHGNFMVTRSSVYPRDYAWTEIETLEDIHPMLDPTGVTIVKPSPIPQNTWVHCLINLTDKEIQGWINGELCVKRTRQYTTYLNTDDEPTYIGNMFNAGSGDNNHLHGALDELRVYNRGLSDLEIQYLYEHK